MYAEALDNCYQEIALGIRWVGDLGLRLQVELVSESFRNMNQITVTTRYKIRGRFEFSYVPSFRR